MLPVPRILCLLGFYAFCLVKSAPVSITGTGVARIYLDDSEAGDADHLDASTLRTANIGAVLELKGSHFSLTLANFSAFAAFCYVMLLSGLEVIEDIQNIYRTYIENLDMAIMA